MLTDLDRIDWRRFDLDRDGPALRDRLFHAPAEARAVATRRIAGLAPLAVPRLQQAGISGLGVDAERRLLAVGGDCHACPQGSTLSVWDLDVVRIVASIDGIAGPVGWSGHSRTVQWSGAEVVLSYDTDPVGVFDPFAAGSGSRHEWYLTDGWDEPPAFAVGPDGRVFVGCWGPDEETGAIVYADDPVQWVAPKTGDGPMRLLAWTAAGVFGNAGGNRRWLDPETGAGSSWPSPGTWSPSGRRVVVGATVRDAQTDAVRFVLPGGEPRERAFHSERDCVFLDDDRLIAVYDDRVEVVDARGAVPIAARPRRPDWQVPDLRPVVASPDGEQLAILGTDGRIRFWGADGRPRAEADGGSATGLYWARADRLVAASGAGLAVLDDAGRSLGAQSMVFPLGWAPPPPDQVADDEAPIVTRVTDRGRIRVGFTDAGLLADPADLPALLPELAYRVGRSAWPADWGTVADLPVSGTLVAAGEPPSGEPFYVLSAADGPPELSFLRRILNEAGVSELTLQSWPIGWYRARDPLVGPLGADQLAPLAGRVVMWVDAWRPSYLQIGALVRGPQGWTTVHRSEGSSGSGGLSPAEIGWIGEAVPVV